MKLIHIPTFADSIILDEDANEVKISTLWKEQTILFSFLRHFGCIACRAQAQQIWNDREKYEKNGARIVFVGNGSPSYIRFFKEDLKITDAPVYTDPSLKVFLAAGFKRGFRALVNTQTVVNGIKLFAGGHKQAAFASATGDHWQLGGVLVMKPGSKVAYHYISEALGDFPPEKDVIEKVE